MSFRIDPRYPNKVIGTSWNGANVLIDATPELLNAARQTELEAASGVRLLRDNATVADFRREHPQGGGREFYAWCTLHQCPPRRTMALELEATGGRGFRPGQEDEDAMTFHPGMKSHTFHPSTMAHTFHPGSSMAETTEPDPLKRTAVPLEDEDVSEDLRHPSDSDIDNMSFPSSVSLAALQKAGIVH